MATDEFGERTEEPTDRRRQQAREQGNVARSQDLNSAGHMVAAAFVLSLLGIPLIQFLGKLMRNTLRGPAWLSLEGPFLMKQFDELTEQLAGAVLPVLLLMFAAALFFNVSQVGFLMSPDALIPKLQRLDPIQGLKRILSIQAIVKLLVSLGKLAIVIAIAALSLSFALPEFLALSDQEPVLILAKIHQALVRLAFQLALALVILAVLDFGFQKWKHERDLRMTKQEVREELKQMDGDPLIRQRRREAHRKLAQARELQQVKNADVVVTNPTQIAVALRYDPRNMAAPAVIAKGQGEIALRIRQIAARHGIPIIERKPLAQALYRDVRVGQEIPVEMYEVFVELMAYVYRITGRTPPDLST